MRNLNSFLVFAIAFLAQTLVNAQVVISNGVNDPHSHALLQIVGDGKGLILPVVDDYTQLPNYDEENDTFLPNTEDKGLLVYSKEEKDIIHFDGEKWEVLSKKSLLSSRYVSILSSNKEDIVIVNALGITKYKTLEFNVKKDESKFSFNNLDLELGPEGEIIFKEDGIYRINVSVKGKATGGLSVGNTATVLALRANFFGNNEDKWENLQQHEYLMDGLVITVGKRDMVNSFTIDKSFKANDKIRLDLGLKPDTGLTVGVGATYIPSDPDTFIYIEKLD